MQTSVEDLEQLLSPSFTFDELGVARRRLTALGAIVYHGSGLYGPPGSTLPGSGGSGAVPPPPYSVGKAKPTASAPAYLGPLGRN